MMQYTKLCHMATDRMRMWQSSRHSMAAEMQKVAAYLLHLENLESTSFSPTQVFYRD